MSLPLASNNPTGDFIVVGGLVKPDGSEIDPVPVQTMVTNTDEHPVPTLVSNNEEHPVPAKVVDTVRVDVENEYLSVRCHNPIDGHHLAVACHNPADPLIKLRTTVHNPTIEEVPQPLLITGAVITHIHQDEGDPVVKVSVTTPDDTYINVGIVQGGDLNQVKLQSTSPNPVDVRQFNPAQPLPVHIADPFVPVAIDQPLSVYVSNSSIPITATAPIHTIVDNPIDVHVTNSESDAVWVTGTVGAFIQNSDNQPLPTKAVSYSIAANGFIPVNPKLPLPVLLVGPDVADAGNPFDMEIIEQFPTGATPIYVDQIVDGHHTRAVTNGRTSCIYAKETVTTIRPTLATD